MKYPYYIVVFILLGIVLGLSSSVNANIANEVLFEVHGSFSDYWLPTYWQTRVWGWGSFTVPDRVAVEYKALSPQTVCTAKTYLARSSGTFYNLILSVYEGGLNPESGSLLGRKTIPSTDVPTQFGVYTTFNFDNCLQLKKDTTYWFTWTRSQLQLWNGFYTFYRGDEYPNTKGWFYETSGPYGWTAYSREVSLRLEGPTTKEPVIIVPGILGSRLNRVSDGEEIWPSMRQMIDPIHRSDDYLDELKLDNNGNEIIDINKSEIIESVLFLNQYGELIQKFKNSSYQLGKDLFVVPYDWRLDITKSSLDLDSVISQAVTNSPTGKVNIIAHSMGGLLVKDYLMRNGDAKVNKLIFAGTPHLGAPKAFNALNWGDDFDLRFLGLGLNKNKAKEIMQNMPAAYELLPSQEYLTEAGSYIKDNNGTSLDYSEINQLMLSSDLLSDHRNSDLLIRADQFHQSHDSWLPQSAHVYNLMGCLDPDTIGSFKMGEDGSVDINSVDGDGTVPLISANHIPGKNYFIVYPLTKINHVGLISNDMTIGLLYNLIVSNSDPALPLGVYTSSNCQEQLTAQQASELKRLRFSTHSPVNLHIYDPKGRHTGLTADGNFETNIPDSNFFQVGDNTFISVPGSVSYTVKIDAYATGSFDFKVKELDGNDIQNAAIYADVPIKNPTLEADLQFTGINNLATLNIDEEGDGIDDIGYSLDGHKTYYHDHEPPVITLNDDSVINLNVYDTYLEEGATITDDYDPEVSAVITGEVDIDKLGSYIVRYNTTDASGNQATEITRIVNVIDTEKPIIVLNGNNPATILVHDPYNEEGATINDNYDQDLIPAITGTVDIDAVGTYTLHYNTTDSSGNVADPVDRIVNVVDIQKPIINLNGENPQVIEVHNAYIELGVVVTDNSDIGLIPIINSLDVNTNIVGSYTILYNATDSSSNPADQVERTVQVVDTTAPEINLTSPILGEYPRSTIIPVNFAVFDNYNLADVNVIFDGQDFTSSNIDLLFIPLGPHSLVVTARDGAGNVTIKQFDFILIATIQSTISDLERIFTLGWTNGTVKNSLKTLLSTALSTKTGINFQGKMDSILGTAFLKQLEKEYNKGNINEWAYDLIRENILWLLGN